MARLRAEGWGHPDYTWSKIVVPICWLANSEPWKNFLLQEWEQAGLHPETLHDIAGRLAHAGASDPQATLRTLIHHCRACAGLQAWGYIPPPGQERLMDASGAGQVLQLAVAEVLHAAQQARAQEHAVPAAAAAPSVCPA